MKTSKTIKELLHLMLDHQDLFKSGLCSWNSNLYYHDLITSEEEHKLQRYIDLNKPYIFSSYQAFLNHQNHYYWNKGYIKPRIKWIIKHIKLNYDKKI